MSTKIRKDGMKRIILLLLTGLVWGFGQWTLKYYVDDFGDKTDKPYIVFKTQGTFSNSATSSSPLVAKIIVNNDEVGINFYLHEYGERNPSVGETVGWSRGELTLKLAHSTIETYRLYVYSNTLCMTPGGDDSLLNHLKKENKPIKCHVRIDREYSSVSSEYNFAINPMGFSKAYAKIQKQ
jgi:hypothetical protein